MRWNLATDRLGYFSLICEMQHQDHLLVTTRQVKHAWADGPKAGKFVPDIGAGSLKAESTFGLPIGGWLRSLVRLN